MPKLALDLGRPGESAAHLEEALAASRHIISDLTSGDTGERRLGPGDLRRAHLLWTSLTPSTTSKPPRLDVHSRRDLDRSPKPARAYRFTELRQL